MKQKINLRLIVITVFAVFITTIGITVIFYNLFQQQVKDDLRITTQILRDSGVFSHESKTADKTLIKEAEQRFSLTGDELRITWIGADGTVLYDNDNDANLLENHKDRPEVQEAFANGSGEIVRKSNTMNMNTFYYALRIEDGSVIRLAIKANSIISVLIKVAPAILIILIAVIALSILLAHLLTRQLLAPIAYMANNMDDTSTMPVYKELIPFVTTIRAQHENILAAAKYRQDFTANVSHELKTPLTAISGYAELIENHMVDGEQETHFAEEIRRNADRLVVLINDIIKLSEMDQNDAIANMEQFDLYELAQECMEGLKVNAEKHQVTLTFFGGPCIIRGNRDMMREVIDNLCQNAIRYNNEGGKVRVVVGMEDGKPILEVEDNGIGIPKDQQAHVFERFYRVDKSRSKETGGTGLGLAIVKHIVDLHDAKISLQSEEHKGTRVRVEF